LRKLKNLTPRIGSVKRPRGRLHAPAAVLIPCLRPRRGPLERDRRTQGPALASRNELSTFLAGVERRAFKQAVLAVRDDEAALDIVQDAMLRLAEKYGANPVDELPMLFQRILQNAIRDWFRRQKVRSTWTTLLSAFVPNRDDADDADPLDTLEAEGEPGTAAPSGPEKEVQQSQIVEIIETEISRLPARQREAFLLRYWEELDVAETAAAMGCSEGSVKTHCSRATHTLAAALKARGIEL
jgi:RNA polymerase sigma-70 factor (ECF subfamily)